MKRTISLKLNLTSEQARCLQQTQNAFVEGCNAIAHDAQTNRCWNQVVLHQRSYYSIRKKIPTLGSQMVCNAIRKVCASYKVLKIKKFQEVPKIVFKGSSSIHYCARTFSIKEDTLSLFTIGGRLKLQYQLGAFQEQYLVRGKVKEAELIRRGKRWFFNLVLELSEKEMKETGVFFGIDCGENNLATTSTGTLYGGGELRHKRDKFLARRKKLQSNGSRAAKQLLKRISGKEARCVKETNHLVSKSIIKEAIGLGVKTIVLEDLKHIRKRIKGNKRMRSRLHRWPWHQLQRFIEYKAQTEGINIHYVCPAYSSLTCSFCSCLGTRHKHQFKCSNCGSYQHSDRNAAINHCKLAESVVLATASVNRPMVAV